VITDTATLDSLPPPEVAAGYAELLKTALIAGGDLWERVRHNADAGPGAGAAPTTDPGLIAACALTKLRIVARDERDAGLRQVLNLGHTVGHAIETVTGYASYRHGEAIALGLLVALRLSAQPELRDEVEHLLTIHQLPTRLEHADPDAVVMATARDKKRVGEGSVPFVLLDGPGSPRTGCEVAPKAVIAAVRELSG
jgi:shikimate kinase/3-dehydroquinate synthase